MAAQQPLPKAVFFGCGNHDKGHYYFRADDIKLWMGGSEQEYPRWLHAIDGTFPPAYTTKQSAASLHHPFGASMLAWHDYTIDDRGRSNAAFIYFDPLKRDAVQLWTLFRHYFPKTCARFDAHPIELTPAGKF